MFAGNVVRDGFLAAIVFGSHEGRDLPSFLVSMNRNSVYFLHEIMWKKTLLLIFLNVS